MQNLFWIQWVLVSFGPHHLSFSLQRWSRGWGSVGNALAADTLFGSQLQALPATEEGGSSRWHLCPVQFPLLEGDDSGEQCRCRAQPHGGDQSQVFVEVVWTSHPFGLCPDTTAICKILGTAKWASPSEKVLSPLNLNSWKQSQVSISS